MGRSRKPDAPDVTPNYAGLIALVAGSREDMDVDQITAEIVGCPWSQLLVMEATRAIWDESTNKLDIARTILWLPSHRVRVTDVQLKAYADHARRILARTQGGQT